MVWVFFFFILIMFVLRKKCIYVTRKIMCILEKKNETNESTTKLYNLKINIPEENHIWIYVGYGTMIHLPKKRKGNGRYGTWLYHIWLKHTHKHRESEVPFFGHIVQEPILKGNVSQVLIILLLLFILLMSLFLYD